MKEQAASYILRQLPAQLDTIGKLVARIEVELTVLCKKTHFKIMLNRNKGKQKPLTVEESVTNAVTQAKKETKHDEFRDMKQTFVLSDVSINSNISAEATSNTKRFNLSIN